MMHYNSWFDFLSDYSNMRTLLVELHFLIVSKGSDHIFDYVKS